MSLLSVLCRRGSKATDTPRRPRRRRIWRRGWGGRRRKSPLTNWRAGQATRRRRRRALSACGGSVAAHRLNHGSRRPRRARLHATALRRRLRRLGNNEVVVLSRRRRVVPGQRRRKAARVRAAVLWPHGRRRPHDRPHPGRPEGHADVGEGDHESVGSVGGVLEAKRVGVARPAPEEWRAAVFVVAADRVRHRCWRGRRRGWLTFCRGGGGDGHP